MNNYFTIAFSSISSIKCLYEYISSNYLFFKSRFLNNFFQISGREMWAKVREAASNVS